MLRGTLKKRALIFKGCDHSMKLQHKYFQKKLLRHPRECCPLEPEVSRLSRRREGTRGAASDVSVWDLRHGGRRQPLQVFISVFVNADSK